MNPNRAKNLSWGEMRSEELMSVFASMCSLPCSRSGRGIPARMPSGAWIFLTCRFRPGQNAKPDENYRSHDNPLSVDVQNGRSINQACDHDQETDYIQSK